MSRGTLLHANEYYMLVCCITHKHIVPINIVARIVQSTYVEIHVGVLAYVALQDTHLPGDYTENGKVPR